MAALDNITVGTTQLQAVRQNITDYLYDGQSDFSAQITEMKKQVFAEIKEHEKQNYTSYTNAELDTLLAKIKDMPTEGTLARKIATLTVVKIFADNRMYEDSEYYNTEAAAIPLAYYIDDDSDDTLDIDEDSKFNNVVFGR